MRARRSHAASSSAQGRQVYVNRPRASDAEEFLAGVGASRALHRNRVAPPADRSAYGRYVDRARHDDFEAFLVRRRVDDALIGVVNLSQIFRGGFQNAHLGFYAFAPFTGHGYMTEAVDVALRVAFRSLRLHRIEANVQPENTASRRIVERTGFRLEGYSPRYLKVGGRWRDHERWAILAEEFRS